MLSLAFDLIKMVNATKSLISYFKYFTIYTMCLFYIVIGIKHFIEPDFFIAIVPEFFLFKKELVYLSGFLEVIMGLFLFIKRTRKIGAWGIIILLIGVFPANIYLYLSEIPREVLQITKEQALIRIPFQIPLIILAYWHSKEMVSVRLSIFCSVLFIPTIIYFLSL